jgi:hypothetical protein
MARTSAATKSAIETLFLEDQIRRRAHELYLERGNASGSQLDDWLRAEREILMSREHVLEEPRIVD